MYYVLLKTTLLSFIVHDQRLFSLFLSSNFINVLKQNKFFKHNDPLLHELGVESVNPFKALKIHKFHKEVPLHNRLSKESKKESSTWFARQRGLELSHII